MSTAQERSDHGVLGVLTFDEGSGELSGPGATVRLAPQPAALLSLLVSHRGEVVTRDTIKDHLWSGGKVEFEQGIAFAVREIRKAIEAAGGESALLETIPKRGFRLRPTDGGLAGQQTRPPRLSPSVIAGVVAVVGVAAAVGVLALRPALDRQPVLAIFTHGAVEPASTRIAETLGFELTAALTERLAGRIAVVGPTGTASLSGPGDTDAVRSALGACLVMSGQVRLIGGDSVVVFTQIVRTSDRVHVWAAQDTSLSQGISDSVVAAVLNGTQASLDGCDDLDLRRP